MQYFRGFNAVYYWHDNVHEHNVRLILLAQGNTLLAIRALPNQFYIGCRAQNRLDDPVYLEMVVNQDNTDGIFSGHLLQNKEAQVLTRVYFPL